MKAGFASIDITPERGVRKGGWLTYLPVKDILDPLFAHAAVLESQGVGVGFIQLDVLSIPRNVVAEIRRRIEAQTGFPGENIMIAATHNHAGPDLHASYLVDPEQTQVEKKYRFYPRDEKLKEFIINRCTKVFLQAWTVRENAVLGYGCGLELHVAYNRRMVMRDGTVKTQFYFNKPDVLYQEGPADPEVSVLGVKAPEGKWLGCLVNYSGHPIHHGGSNSISAGYPGVLSRLLQERGYGTCLYLNGASGNTALYNPATGVSIDKEQAGGRLADVVTDVLGVLEWLSDCSLASETRTLQLPFREITEAEIRGEVFGAQRFIDPKLYEVSMPYLVERMRERKSRLAHIQAIHIGPLSYVGIPAEYFVEYGLRLKIAAHPRRAHIVGQANGMVGYVPTREAFQRGGYETTFGLMSHLAPEAGDRILDAAVELVCHKSVRQ